MPYMELVFRVLLALALGFVIGLERQLTGHTAGIRINVLLCMGSAFFSLIPMLYGSDETFRVEAAVIQGVGFLCSGVIFKDHMSVRGINTAATLWCTSAVGILASTGMWLVAVTVTAVLVLSNLLFRILVKKIKPVVADEENERTYQISVTCQEAAEQDIRLLLINTDSCKTLYLNSLESGDAVGDKVEIVAKFSSAGKPKNHVLEGVVGRMLMMPAVVSAGWEVL